MVYSNNLFDKGLYNGFSLLKTLSNTTPSTLKHRRSAGKECRA
jgi:hypothetical protein